MGRKRTSNEEEASIGVSRRGRAVRRREIVEEEDDDPHSAQPTEEEVPADVSEHSLEEDSRTGLRVRIVVSGLVCLLRLKLQVPQLYVSSVGDGQWEVFLADDDDEFKDPLIETYQHGALVYRTQSAPPEASARRGSKRARSAGSDDDESEDLDEEDDLDEDREGVSPPVRMRVPVAEHELPVPSGSGGRRKDAENAEEAALRKSEAQRKRRILSLKADEEEKRAVIEKLLKNTDARILKADKAKRIREIHKEIKAATRTAGDVAAPQYVRLQVRIHPADPQRVEWVLGIPEGQEGSAELGPWEAITPPSTVMCWSPGCGRPKRYSCSRTKLPVCSLDCYRKIPSH